MSSDGHTYRVEEVMAEATRDGRVCPHGDPWLKIYNMLPPAREGETFPPVPLILGGWHLPNESKRERFHQHIHWAHEHGVLDGVAKVIFNTPDRFWAIERKYERE